MQTQTRFSLLQNFLRGIQGCHMKADVLPFLKMWWFFMLYFFKRDLLLPKVRSNLKIFFCKVVSQRVPEEELKSEFNRKDARTIIPSNFPVEL